MILFFICFTFLTIVFSAVYLTDGQEDLYKCYNFFLPQDEDIMSENLYQSNTSKLYDNLKLLDIISNYELNFYAFQESKSISIDKLKPQTGNSATKQQFKNRVEAFYNLKYLTQKRILNNVQEIIEQENY